MSRSAPWTDSSPPWAGTGSDARWDRDRHGHPGRPGELICHGGARLAPHSDPVHRVRGPEGIAQSIGTVGEAYDNGLMEGIIGLFKIECIRTTILNAGRYKGSVEASVVIPVDPAGGGVLGVKPKEQPV